MWYMHVNACGGQKHLIPLELELWEVVSGPTLVLGTKLRSSERAIDIFNSVIISLSLLLNFDFKFTLI